MRPRESDGRRRERCTRHARDTNEANVVCFGLLPLHPAECTHVPARPGRAQTPARGAGGAEAGAGPDTVIRVMLSYVLYARSY